MLSIFRKTITRRQFLRLGLKLSVGALALGALASLPNIERPASREKRGKTGYGQGPYGG